MESSNVEVRLFLQHLAQWLSACSQRQTLDCDAALERLADRGRLLCANPEFQRHFRALAARHGCEDTEAALGALCAFLSAITRVNPSPSYHSGT